MKVNGGTIKCMARGRSSGLMGGFMSGSILKTRSMALEECNGPMEKCTKATGERVSKMARVKSEGLME